MIRNIIYAALFSISVAFGAYCIVKYYSPVPTTAAAINKVEEIKIYPLAWEAKDPSRKAWSEHLYKEIESKFESFEARDITYFCPNYDNIPKQQKINVWAQIICMMAYYESNWKPNVRYVEHSLGIDPVTQRTNTSEGLLQVGYADSLYHKCDFNWEKDKALADDDSNKTIFNPYLNLSCGVKILSKQVATHKALVINRGAYWSVIKEGHRNSKIPQIISAVSKFPPCVLEEEPKEKKYKNTLQMDINP